MGKRQPLKATDLDKLRKYQFRKGDPKPPGSGMQKRAIPKRTMEFVERMDELHCHPEEFLARVIIGQEPPASNPFYEVLKLWCENNRDKPLTGERIDKLLGRAAKYLKYEPAPIDIRVNAARDLMQYKYPKRKAVEHSGNINVGTGVMYVPQPANSGADSEARWIEEAEKESRALLNLEHSMAAPSEVADEDAE